MICEEQDTGYLGPRNKLFPVDAYIIVAIKGHSFTRLSSEISNFINS